MTSQEREDRDSIYDGIVDDPYVLEAVLRHISFVGSPDEPAVAPMDIAAARHYLRRCMANMSMTELQSKRLDDFAALWARGAIGAARYRVRRRPVSRRAGNTSRLDDD